MLDRTVAPPVQPLARVTLPAADVLTLPSGARLHVLANDAQPVVRLQAVFRAGKTAEPRPGLASVTARMLLEGTTTRTARQIADEVAFYGASLECDAGFDRSTLTLYCLTRHLPALLPLVTDVLTNPAFPEAELQQLKTRTIQNVSVERQKTSYLASERFNELQFGSETPYGRPFDSATYQALTVAEAQAFHQTAYAFGNAEVFLCGDVAAEREWWPRRSARPPSRPGR
ncbi:M16 family metallopeptidase [Hymenobacter humi]|uniref:M16 family metallopeptidase n=1 Tax=Hymenobacter humi TaxID=1411620 RepID=A0ABW2TXQ7_9BACT